VVPELTSIIQTTPEYIKWGYYSFWQQIYKGRTHNICAACVNDTSI